MITAAPLTTKRNGKNLPTHVTIRAGEVEGIYQDSIVSVESAMPVEKINFTKKIGTINESVEFQICECFAIQIPFLQKWLEKKIKEREEMYELERAGVAV